MSGFSTIPKMGTKNQKKNQKRKNQKKNIINQKYKKKNKKNKKCEKQCDLPFCENTTNKPCPDCKKMLCHDCMLGVLSFCPDSEDITQKCPFCRQSFRLSNIENFDSGKFCNLKYLLNATNRTTVTIPSASCCPYGFAELRVLSRPCPDCNCQNTTLIAKIWINSDFTSDSDSDDDEHLEYSL